jgi:hypothetical protein
MELPAQHAKFPLGLRRKMLEHVLLIPAGIVDWGDISESDRQQNELALTAGLRILSSYALPNGDRVWLITEWDRSATTILLPDDY